MSGEAHITINGVKLTFGQAMTLRVAITGFLMDLQRPDALGSDESGRAIAAGYKSRCKEIERLLFIDLTLPPT